MIQYIITEEYWRNKKTVSEHEQKATSIFGTTIYLTFIIYPN